MKLRIAAAVLVGGAVVAALVPSVLAQSSLAVTVDRVGWWTNQPVSAPAGEGAFEVATAPDGSTQSVAAFQVSIPAEQVDSFALTLVETAGYGSEFASVSICRTDESWDAVDPGALDDAPTPDCATRIHLTRVLEERTWIGDIAPVVAGGGTVSLMVLPEYHPPVPLGTGMASRVSEIGIEAKGSAGATTTTTTALDFTTPGGSNQYDPVPDSGITSGPDPYVDVPSSGSADFGSPPAADDPATEPTGGGDDEVAVDEEFFALDPEEAVAGDSRPWVRLVFIVPLAVAFGLGSARLRRLALEGRIGRAGSPA